MGPNATPTPAIAAQYEIARARSSGGNTLVINDNVLGMMNAPPIPMTARVAISCDGEVANAESNDPSPNTTMPNCSAPLRPKRSPRLPAVSSKHANTSVYESTIHCSWLNVASRSVCRCGNATLRIELSTMMTSRLRHNTPSTHQRSRYERVVRSNGSSAGGDEVAEAMGT